MKTEKNTTKKKHSLKKIILWAAAVLFIYNNFNRLLTIALIKNFNSSIISDVYELKFEKLSVNLLEGDIKVYNVVLQPREKPLHSYPYINSSFRLVTKKMLLENVKISALIKSNTFNLDKIEIREPDVELTIGGKIPIMFPIRDTTTAQAEQSDKRFIESYLLKKFELGNASFHVIDSARAREFKIQQLNISLNDLVINQQPGMDELSYQHVDFSIGAASGNLNKEAIKYISFKNYKVSIDSLEIRKSTDTVIFHFADFSTGIKALDIQTADSTAHLTMQSFDLSYKDSSIKLDSVVFKPEISNAAMQKRSKYQSTQFSGSVGTMQMLGINFDSLIYSRKIFIDEIILDKVSASIFKDQRKPVDRKHLPGYPGQQIKGIPTPLLIKHLRATNVNLVNTEQKLDGGIGKANVNRLTLDVKNITNLSPDGVLTANADAYIEQKVHANVSLIFSYGKPQYSMNGTIKKFNLPDLNPLLYSYTQAGIKSGIADIITFSGNVYRTNASGTMKFLYHDLKVDMAMEENMKWQNSILAFAANTYLNSANPPSADLPPRIVRFRVERDMHKGFVNILIKSVINGVKETMIMSKENKKIYRKQKKEAKKKARQERKKNK